MGKWREGRKMSQSDEKDNQWSRLIEMMGFF